MPETYPARPEAVGVAPRIRARVLDLALRDKIAAVRLLREETGLPAEFAVPMVDSWLDGAPQTPVGDAGRIGGRLLDVVAVMDRLRSPGGCPWDAEQTHTTLMPYLLEEAYEAYAALEDGDLVDLREELGDVLLQVVFHARLAEEAQAPWSIDDVAGDLVDKLVRRHPHVFAGTSADDLEGTWEALKKAEKGRTSVTDGVPLGQPALALAAKLQRRAGRIGAPVPAFDGLGGELWELVRRCAQAGLDPEVALRTTARNYRDRLAAVEAELHAAGRDPSDVGPGEWAALLSADPELPRG